MIKVGSKVNLIKEVVLTGMKKPISVDKKNPCKGTILSMRAKIVAGKRVTMCGFRPDKVKDDSVWTFGLKAFEEIKE